GGFVAHHFEQLGARADECNASLRAGAGKSRILGKETVTGMNRVDAFFLRHRDNAIDVEISGNGTLALADQVSFVRLETMEAEAILLRVHGDGAQAKFGAGTENTNGDFAAIGSEQFLKRMDGAALRAGFTTADCGHASRLYSRVTGEWQPHARAFGTHFVGF